MRDHRNETTRCLVSYIITPYLEPVTLYFAQVDFVPSYTNQVYHDDPLYVDALDPLVRLKAKIRLMIFHELEAHHDHGAFTINRPVPRSYCTDSVNPVSIGPRNEKDDLCQRRAHRMLGPHLHVEGWGSLVLLRSSHPQDLRTGRIGLPSSRRKAFAGPPPS